MEGEVTDIEGRVNYHMRRVKSGNDLTPLTWHRGGLYQDHARGEPIRGQVIRE